MVMLVDEFRMGPESGRVESGSSGKASPAATAAIFRVGTLGYLGDRYPVSQYAVAGSPQLGSNPYLGWALPFGS